MSELEAISLMQEHGLEVRHLIFNKLTRVKTTGNPSQRNGWYKLFSDTGSINGVFGDYSQSQPGNDSGVLGKIPLTFAKLDEKSFKKLQNEITERNNKECERQYKSAKEAARKALEVWNRCVLPGEYISTAYSIRKHIAPYGARFGKSDTLIIPMYFGGLNEQNIVGLQVIYPKNGMWGENSPDKRYYPKGLAKKGGYFLIDGCVISLGDDPVLLCEGYATGCSIFEATGLSAFVAFDAGNLIHVAKMIRDKIPHKRIIICADDDHATKGNPGISHADSCASIVEMVDVAIPVFPFREEGDKTRTDFNDLHVLYGLEEVRRQLQGAINVL